MTKTSDNKGPEDQSDQSKPQSSNDDAAGEISSADLKLINDQQTFVVGWAAKLVAISLIAIMCAVGGHLLGIIGSTRAINQSVFLTMWTPAYSDVITPHLLGLATVGSLFVVAVPLRSTLHAATNHRRRYRGK